MYQPQYDLFYPNVAVIKKYFNSKPVLANAVLKVVALITLIFRAIALIPVYAQAIPRLISYMENRTDMLSNPLLQINVSPVNFTTFLIAGAGVFAAFFVYFKSKNENPSSNPRAGFLIKHILTVYLLVNSIVSLAINTLTAVVGIFVIVSLARDLSSIIIGVCVCIFFLALAVLDLLFSRANLQYIKSVRHSMNQPQLENNGAKHLGVFSVISAAFYGWMALAAAGLLITLLIQPHALQNCFVDTDLLLFPAAVLLISYIVSVLLSITNAKIAFGYHKYVDDINSGRFTPDIPEVEYIAPPQISFAETAPPVYVKDDAAFVQSDSPYSVGSPDDIPSPIPPRRCPYCGSTLSEGSIFCSHCGNKVQ